jgi:hypothetical protein
MREKQRLAAFEANVQRKRLGLPRLETEPPPSAAASASPWDELGLSRVRPGTLPLLAAAAGLQLQQPARPMSSGLGGALERAARERLHQRPPSRLALK